MRRFIIFCIIICQTVIGFAQRGIPFFVNFSSEQYGAHNRNFNIICDHYGRVYVANFEGLLYYDLSEWKVIHTPDISRVTILYQDKQHRIWVGGYNEFGYLDADEVGRLVIRFLSIESNIDTIGSIMKIEEVDGLIKVYTSKGNVFVVSDHKLIKEKEISGTDIILEDYYKEYKINQKLKLENGVTLLATSGNGVVALDSRGNEIYVLSEENGLCNNNVNSLATDGHGYVWGATDGGLFCINATSIYSRFTVTEGLKGEVLDIYEGDEGLYVGTLQGLFYLSGNCFVQVPQIRQACWKIVHLCDGKLLAATSDGLFMIHSSSIEQLTTSQALSVYPDSLGGYYIGELDGIYYLSLSGEKKLISPIERVENFLESGDGSLWVNTMYGQVYRKDIGSSDFILQKINNDESNGLSTDYNILFKRDKHVYILNHKGIYLWSFDNKELLPDTTWIKGNEILPQLVYTDFMGRLWLTDSQGKELAVFSHNNSEISEEIKMTPLSGYNVSALCVLPNEVWVGGNFGLVTKDLTRKDRELEEVPRVFIRGVSLANDSILYGGFDHSDNLNPRPMLDKLNLGSEENSIRFNYSLNNISILGKTMYRYRLKEGDNWSSWSESTTVQFTKLWYGDYTFEVMALDKYGRQSDIASVKFYIAYPIYLKWYSVVCYILLVALVVLLLLRFRTHRLMKEKLHLEELVEQRTYQIRSQKEEIEEKSRSLEKALDELGKAQNSLIRQEKMATVGQLTKGLIDRILNPLNYINNFSHLTQGLVKDIVLNLEDEKENINDDVYDDTEEILSMVNMNLSKIEAHGVNVTRILKAMEEVLKERSTVLHPLDLMICCRKNFEMLNTYYAQDIKDYNIHTEFIEQLDFVAVNANAEQLSKTIMSLLANSVYAVKKKYSQKPYDALIRFSVDLIEGKQVCIHIFDNGIGIEDTIIEHIFDPFFTTKTTGEAAGVGLFLSREIILNHHGTITVDSQKNEYTEFIITLPLNNDDSSKTNNMIN